MSDDFRGGMRQPSGPARAPAGGLWLLLALLLPFAGCGSAPMRGQDARESIPMAGVERVDSEVRAEFEAAMKVLNAGNLEQGIALLVKLTEHAKSNTAPYINLAIAYQQVDNLPAAEESLKKALEINPDHPVANNEYGLVYRKTGRFAEARKTYERALEKAPEFLPARKNLAILCDLYLRDLECALKHYELYGRAKPDDKTVDIWIADLKTRLGR